MHYTWWRIFLFCKGPQSSLCSSSSSVTFLSFQYPALSHLPSFLPPFCVLGLCDETNAAVCQFQLDILLKPTITREGNRAANIFLVHQQPPLPPSPRPSARRCSLFAALCNCTAIHRQCVLWGPVTTMRSAKSSPVWCIRVWKLLLLVFILPSFQRTDAKLWGREKRDRGVLWIMWLVSLSLAQSCYVRGSLCHSSSTTMM